ncbi:amidohydrolase [candidate division KSB1 bacterium]|nr:amidohydrolase family protein [candidate division KSB1 bacterium]RQW06892.1 MAG: amidohydrolase [candidate division KSB1 bacterium]
MKIDAHQHFWHYSAAEYGWITDSMATLRRDFLPNELEKILTTNGFAGSVAVQARQTSAETQWLLDLADQHPVIEGVVGWVDLRSEHLDEQLARFASHPKFVGVRHVVQDEPDVRFLLGETFMRGVEKLLEHNLTYDILIFPKQLAACSELVKNFPEHRFMLDHIGKPAIKDGFLSPWKKHIQQLAAFPHVFCKISGLVTEADWQHWQLADFEPYLDVIINAFGMDRLLFGSDWPVCTLAASYDKVIDIVESYLDKHNFSDMEKAAFWGGNAVKFYQL